MIRIVKILGKLAECRPTLIIAGEEYTSLQELVLNDTELLEISAFLHKVRDEYCSWESITTKAIASVETEYAEKEPDGE